MDVVDRMCSDMLVHGVFRCKDPMPRRLCWTRSMATCGAELRNILRGFFRITGTMEIEIIN